MAAVRTRLAVVGAGDVAYRHYLPALQSLADRVEVVAVVDRREGAGEAAVAAIADWSPNAVACHDLTDIPPSAGVEAAINLTPATLHGELNQAILDLGWHLYSEKPIA